MSGKFDALDRLAQVVIGLVAFFALSNGLAMLISPLGWYGAIDTVPTTGPANAHFIMDIGLAFIVSGLLLAYSTPNPAMRWGSALAGSLWLLLHGLLHAGEFLTGHASLAVFLADAPGVLAPPLLVIGVIVMQLARQRLSPAPLPKHLYVRLMERITGGSESYVEDLADAGGFAVEKFQYAMPLSGHGWHAPAGPIHMARLGATRAEDCGACVEIVRSFALADGLEAGRVQDALLGKPHSAADKLAYDFGSAVALGDIARSAELGDQLESQYSRAVRTELSLAAASTRLYPAIKRGLGYASACSIPQVK